jgi:lipopolysaccharide export system permease protein
MAANMILLPFGVWMTYKALTDSQLFDAEKYKAFSSQSLTVFPNQKSISAISKIQLETIL